MEIELSGFHQVLAPRTTALITTLDKEGRANAAPFSLVSPVSFDPPLVMFAAKSKRDTLANARETGEFVLNMVPEELLDKLWICSKSFPAGVSEIAEAGLTERKSRVVKAPSIEECVAWVECRYEWEKEAGDHIMVVGSVVHAECKDEFVKGDQYDVAGAKPLLHIRGRRFVPADSEVLVKEE